MVSSSNGQDAGLGPLALRDNNARDGVAPQSLPNGDAGSIPAGTTSHYTQARNRVRAWTRAMPMAMSSRVSRSRLPPRRSAGSSNAVFVWDGIWTDGDVHLILLPRNWVSRVCPAVSGPGFPLTRTFSGRGIAAYFDVYVRIRHCESSIECKSTSVFSGSS